MNEPPQDYYAFLLRLFQVVENGQSAWRVSQQEPGNEQLQKFSSLQEFVEFLMSITKQTNSYSIHHQLVERKANDGTTIEIKLIITSPRGEQEQDG